jgi:hypothetical protein
MSSRRASPFRRDKRRRSPARFVSIALESQSKARLKRLFDTDKKTAPVREDNVVAR